MISQGEVEEALESLAPSHLAESWDNIGWQVRANSDPIRQILCSVDATVEVIDEAVERGANLIVSHHPLLFHALKSIDASQPVGAVAAHAVRSNVSILAAHTNWDASEGGVSWALAQALDLEPEQPLLPIARDKAEGLGVLCTMTGGISEAALEERLRSRLAAPVMGRAGPIASGHERVALMGGSGSIGITQAVTEGATLYVTADVRYHEAQAAAALGLALLIIDHGASERPGMAELARRLAPLLEVPVTLSDISTSPWRY